MDTDPEDGPNSEDWEVTPEAQPRPDAYGFDLDAALASVVAVSARVAEDAFTAQTLGVERAGNGVVIREDGVVLTIGYLVTEAEQVSLTTVHGRTVPGHVLGVDQVNGFAMIQALEPLGVPALRIGDSRYAQPGEPVIVAGVGGRRRSIAARIVGRQEFAGYWEYLIEEAIFTAPAHPSWGGAALISPSGELIGIGSLQLQTEGPGGRVRPLNMIVPLELLTPIHDELLTGRVGARVRPWLGVFAQEMQGRVVLVGFAGHGPAARAGLLEGDIVHRCAGMEVADLADFYRSVWALGKPGVEVPLVVERDGAMLEIAVTSADRRDFLKKRRLN